METCRKCLTEKANHEFSRDKSAINGLSRLCKACNYAHLKEWRSRPENREKRAAEGRRWRAKHPEVYALIKARHREKNLETLRERFRLDKAATYATEMAEAKRARADKWRLKRDNERIAIAGRPKPDTCEICAERATIVWDHCHATGVFRGWICDRCNKTLGHVKDNAALLRTLAVYIENHEIRYIETKKAS